MVNERVPRWRLLGYRKPIGEEKGEQLIHDETCVGDAALQAALDRLERRSDFHRAAVQTETLGNRQTFTAPVIRRALSRPLGDPIIGPTGPICSICDMPKSECLRRAATNGHEFTKAQ